MRKHMLLAAVLTGLSLGAFAQGQVNIICSVQAEWCNMIATVYARTTGAKVNVSMKGSGEALAQIMAEKDNPKTDIWFGGTGDPHLQAAEEDLTEAYESPLLGELHDWALDQHEASNGRTVGIYAGALGFGYNKELLAQKKIAAPKCWADLIKPEFKGEIQIANPNSSGTAYTALATFVQMMGEDQAFDYLKKLHANVNQYTKSGSAPVKAAAQGETTVGIVFQHDAVTMAVSGAPIEVVSPCEGTGYEIGSMSIIKGARNEDSAKKFYDFALRADVQTLAKDAKAYQVPSNKKAVPPPEAPDFATIKLIDYDFKKYGSSEERGRLLTKWEQEVNSLPR
jgi:iron(III) transport system substrate-binding protein